MTKTKMFWVLWITYASFYLGRVNLGVALPGIMKSFGLSKTSVGIIGAALFWAYALGQLVNGYLGDRIDSRTIVAVGLVVSAAMNLIFPVQTSLVALVVVWAVNGYFQACGWGPMVKILANWVSGDERGKMSGWLGTSYILGSAVSALIAGFVYNETQNWHAVFIVPAFVMFLSAGNWLSRLDSRPIRIAQERTRHFLTRGVYGNWRVWAVGMALFCTNILRYGFLGWAVTYFFEVQGAAISMAAYKTIIFPVAGAAGAVVAGWLSDKVDKRASVAAIFLALAGVGSLLFPMAGSWLLGLMFLALTGFAIFGAHPLLVAAAPMDYGTHRAASAATGFIDSLGYIGAGFTAVGTGFLVQNWGWSAGFTFWICAAFIGFALMMILFLVEEEKGYNGKR